MANRHVTVADGKTLTIIAFLASIAGVLILSGYYGTSKQLESLWSYYGFTLLMLPLGMAVFIALRHRLYQVPLVFLGIVPLNLWLGSTVSSEIAAATAQATIASCLVFGLGKAIDCIPKRKRRPVKILGGPLFRG